MCVVIQKHLHCFCLSRLFKHEITLKRSARTEIHGQETLRSPLSYALCHWKGNQVLYFFLNCFSEDKSCSHWSFPMDICKYPTKYEPTYCGEHRDIFIFVFFFVCVFCLRAEFSFDVNTEIYSLISVPVCLCDDWTRTARVCFAYMWYCMISMIYVIIDVKTPPTIR